jgi:RES domain-containing protein
MMNVYRISKTRWAEDLSGKGARLHGGRWNHVGTPCLYAAESRALAILEYTVNVNADDIPSGLSLITIRIPEKYLTVRKADLPVDWDEVPAPPSTRDFGTNLFSKRSQGIFMLPSVVVPQESILIINPLHEDAMSCKLISVEAFSFDDRIRGK